MRHTTAVRRRAAAAALAPLCAVQVSPHEFLQAVVSASKKRFRIDRQGDPVEFLAWFLHELHRCGARVRDSAHAVNMRVCLDRLHCVRKMARLQRPGGHQAAGKQRD